jgi:hypothetical protein
MTRTTISEVLKVYDQQSQTAIDQAEAKLLQGYAIESLAPSLVAAFPQVRNWQGRNAILFSLLPLARKSDDVFQLALQAIGDRAYMVQMQACAALAYSLRRDALPQLAKLLTHRNAKTRSKIGSGLRYSF